MISEIDGSAGGRDRKAPTIDVLVKHPAPGIQAAVVNIKIDPDAKPGIATEDGVFHAWNEKTEQFEPPL